MKRCSHHKGVEGARAQKVSLVVRARMRDAACYALHRYTGHPLRRNRVDAVAYQRVRMAQVDAAHEQACIPMSLLTPSTPVTSRRAQLLSNGRYTVMLTPAGSG